MPRKPAPAALSLDDLLDGALNSVLNAGWDDEPKPTPVPDPVPAPAARTYPPLPKRDNLPLAIDGVAAFPATAESTQKSDGPEIDDREDQEPPASLMDIGLLTDLATGRKGAVEAAEAAGVTDQHIQSALATALHGIDPGEIAKALGIQAAEQQLKSGALYGAVLFDLVADMKNGRMKPDTKIELLKLLAKVGRIEPKEDKNVGAGGGFTLNISLGGTPAEKQIIIDPH